MGYKVILFDRTSTLTCKQIIVTKKTPETLEVFPKETFTSLMVVLQSSKSLDLCLDSSRKIYNYLREFDITYWLKTLPQKWIEAFAL